MLELFKRKIKRDEDIDLIEQEARIIEVDFTTKYFISDEIYKKVKNRDEQAFTTLLEHYKDIIEAIIKKYSPLFNYNEEEIEHMRYDGQQALKEALYRLPSFEYIKNLNQYYRLDDYWHSYILAHIIWYIYFFTVVKRKHPNLKVERYLETGCVQYNLNGRFHAYKDIKDIYDTIFAREFVFVKLISEKDRPSEKDKFNYNSVCDWENVLYDLDERFNIEMISEDEDTSSKILQLANCRLKRTTKK